MVLSICQLGLKVKLTNPSTDSHGKREPHAGRTLRGAHTPQHSAASLSLRPRWATPKALCALGQDSLTFQPGCVQEQSVTLSTVKWGDKPGPEGASSTIPEFSQLLRARGHTCKGEGISYPSTPPGLWPRVFTSSARMFYPESKASWDSTYTSQPFVLKAVSGNHFRWPSEDHGDGLKRLSPHFTGESSECGPQPQRPGTRRAAGKEASVKVGRQVGRELPTPGS